MAALEFSMLGPLAARRDGAELDLGSRKQRALLAFLLIHRRRLVSADQIVMALWGPDAPDTRRKDVWVYMSRLRKALGEDAHGDRPVVKRDAGGYSLDVAEEAVDVAQFELLLEEGRRLLPSDPPAASLVLAEALAMWGGDALQEFAAEPFAAAEVARLEEARFGARELQIRADMAWKDSDRVIPEISALVRRFPLRPELTASLMIALYRQGRQAEALQAYQRLADALGEQSGLEPPYELKLLEEQILLDAPLDVRGTLGAAFAGLPEPIARFVGRSEELEDLAELVEEHRLVTITGPGGIGKTSLAVEFGRRASLRYEDTALVDLIQADVSGDVLTLLADALRCRAEGRNVLDALVARLSSRRALVIFDNCEHVVAAVVDTAIRLLERAPGLRIIATSRQTLGISGERLYSLAPLSTAEGGDGDQLLADRIALLGDDIADTVDAAARQQLRERTAGFPLLIELAAGQLRAFSPSEVIAALETSASALAAPRQVGPERHRDPMANVAWSEQLLPAAAAVLLRRLAVFRSGASLVAIERVAGFAPLDPGAVRSALRRLIDGSLLIADRGATTRYRLLEPIRQFAQARLEEEGEADVVAQNHADYFLDLFSDGPARVQTGSGLAALRPDGPNLDAAIRLVLAAGDAERAQRAAARAIPFWEATEDAQATLPLVEDVLAADTSPTKARAELLHVAGPTFGRVKGRDIWFGDVVGELRSIAAVLDDPEVDACVLRRDADLASLQGSPGDVIRLYEKAIEACERAGLSLEALRCHHNLAWSIYWLPDHLDDTDLAIDRWASAAVASGSERHIADSQMVRAWAALARNDHALVEQLSTEAADAFRDLGDYRAAATMSQPLALSSLMLGETERALRRVDTSIGALEEMGLVVFGIEWRLLRAAILLDHDERSAAISELTTACTMTLDIADDEATTTALALVGRDLIRLAPPQAAAVLAAHSAHTEPRMFGPTPRFIVPALDRMHGDPEVVLAGLLDSVAYTTERRRGAGMSPHDAFVDTVRVLETLTQE